MSSSNRPRYARNSPLRFGLGRRDRAASSSPQTTITTTTTATATTTTTTPRAHLVLRIRFRRRLRPLPPLLHNSPPNHRPNPPIQRTRPPTRHLDARPSPLNSLLRTRPNPHARPQIRLQTPLLLRRQTLPRPPLHLDRNAARKTPAPERCSSWADALCVSCCRWRGNLVVVVV